MERKFASKLSQLKPAAEARKQASSQLKETIQSSKFKQVEPIDYDSYIEQNYANLRKDICSRQLILLPSDDIYADDYEESLDENNENLNGEETNGANVSNSNELNVCLSETNPLLNSINNLFVNDCLKTYCNKKFEIKYKHHAFGGNYRQLPNYYHNSVIYIEQSNDAVTKFINKNLLIPESNFEVDMEDSSSTMHNQLGINYFTPQKNQAKVLGSLEKNGWLNYKMISSLNDNKDNKSYKRRYFHLRQSYSPVGSRNNSLDKRHSKDLSDKSKLNPIFVLECFKEVPGMKKNENPKHQIIFESNMMTIKNTSNKNQNGQFSFEIAETPLCVAGSTLPKQSEIVMHLFVADNQKQFDDWYSILDKAIYHHYKSSLDISNSAKGDRRSLQLNQTMSSLSSPSSSSSGASPSNPQHASPKRLDEIQSSSFNDSSDSRDCTDSNKLLSSPNQKFVNTFDLNKYLNEKDEDLVFSNSSQSVSKEQIRVENLNAFDIYPKTESADFVDEETELECVWPEKSVGRKLLVNFLQFKLNLNLPIISMPCISQSIQSNSFKINTSKTSDPSSPTSINPELFYIQFSLYDAKSNQKISENFNWIPNYEMFLNQLTKSKSFSGTAQTSSNVASPNSLQSNQNKSNLFTFDGTNLIENAFTAFNFTELKQKFLNKISKALFTVLDIHEEIYLVAKIEKILDGNNIHSSVHPYLIQMTESNKIKAGIKLNKKMHQLIKTQLFSYRQPFAWAAKPVYRRSKNGANYELDNETQFSIFEQDSQHLSDDDLFRYLGDFRFRERYLNKLLQINGNFIITMDDYAPDILEFNNSVLNKSNIINSSMNLNASLKLDQDKIKDYVLNLDYFDPILTIDSSLLSNISSQISQYSPSKVINNNNSNPSNNSNANSISTFNLISGQTKSQDQFTSPNIGDMSKQNNANANSDGLNQITSEQIQMISKAQLLQVNNEFKSYLYVYPKFLKYDTQKTFSKARNILIKVELRDKDTVIDETSIAPSGLKCIYKLNSSFTNSSDNGVLASSYSTCITHHNKNPQFYDEIKILLPLNLTEKHHLLFKFYHVSCTIAKSRSSINQPVSDFDSEPHNASLPNTSSNLTPNLNLSSFSTSNIQQKHIENLIGYAWLPVFKNGRVLNAEKNLPIAQTLSNNYLSFEQIGLGQSIGPNDIKWVDNMKPLFKVNCICNSTVHTFDPHVANFYSQCEKLNATMQTKFMESNGHTPNGHVYNPAKRKAPVSPTTPTTIKNHENEEITIVVNDSNKEVIRNSFKALHATEISTIIKFLPTLLNRILNTLVTTVSNDVAIHSVRALLHIIWQATTIGKIENLKAFIKYVFNIDYSDYFNQNSKRKEIIEHSETENEAKLPKIKTIHDELISNLVILFKQNIPIQDVVQMNRLLKNCWFFLEIILKSLSLFTIQYKRYRKNWNLNPTFEQDFYNNLRNLYEMLVDLFIKYGSISSTSSISKDPEFVSSFKTCNRSLAMFIKKSLNILNRKFLFSLINKYLENFHLCDKQLYPIKFDFIRIICNHEHYVSFCLPVRKSISNINEYADLKYEFFLSDQFRQFHFPVGVLLSLLCTSLNENKEQRKIAIQIFRNLLCKHSYDTRYNTDKAKQARIASLYLPLIDILLENLSRMTGNAASNQKTAPNNPNMNGGDSITTVNTNKFPYNSSVSAITTTSSVTITPQINNSQNGTASSASISNGTMFVSNFENGVQRNSENNSVLGVIAGLSNPNKLQDHLDSIIGPMSDTDSLSSADDSQFKILNKRASSSIVTGSTSSDNQTTANSNIASSLAAESSASKSYLVKRKDKLDSTEVKDLLMCAVYVLRYLSEDILLGLIVNYDDAEFTEFLSLLELALKTFHYRGKMNIQKLNVISKGHGLIKSPRSNGEAANSRNNMDLFDKIANSAISSSYLNRRNTELELKDKTKLNGNGVKTNGTNGTIDRTDNKGHSNVNHQKITDLSPLDQQVIVESNLSHQIGLVVMNILSLIVMHQKEKLCENHGENQITKKLIEIYFYLLQSNQSEAIKLKVLASLRILINKTPSIFLEGPSNLCCNLCLELLECFNSKFQSIRVEACVVLYLLMRKNYEHTKQKSIARVNSQTIISVSQLIGNMKLTSTKEVMECLSILNSLAFKDQTFQNTRFSMEVDDLTKRISNIFLATSQMKNFQDDTEMLVDSQYSLAKSYANSLELRRTWLNSMAEIHIKEKNFSEAAHCYLHIAALIAENLKHQGLYTLGSAMFKKITPNVELETDTNRNDDIMANGDIYTMSDLNEVKYTITQLSDYLIKAADMLKSGERFDILPDIFKLVAAIHEPRDYEHLKQIHQNIQLAYSIMDERDKRAREKPLGAYYRVSFYGRMFEDENNKVYIYKEPGNTKLFEICDRLKSVYSKRFGSSECVEILSDSRKPTELKLDTTNKNYIQITYVQPYFDEEELENRISYFERHNNLKRFYYETSYQLKDEDLIKDNITESDLQSLQHSELLKLCKRKIILETSHWFPYVKKRILVVYETPIDLNPLETAIDELKQKVEDFELVLRKKDLTLLELYLQGGIMPQVHKGPLAYAEAFLEPTELNLKYSKEVKKKFKLIFKRLIELYNKGIELYGQLATKQNSATPNINNNSSSMSPLSPNETNSNKYTEMHRLLKEKFNEFENSFRNLLLIDGDMELYQEQVNSSHNQINLSTTVSSSHA